MAASAQLFCGPAVDIAETATGGGFNPTRLATASNSVGVLALGSDLVALHIPSLDEFSALTPDISGGDIETVTYTLPVTAQQLGKAALYDIQTVTQSGAMTGCIDARGGTYIYRLPLDVPNTADSTSTKRVRMDSSLELNPFQGLPTAKSCEYGWAGAAFGIKDGSKLGVCHGLGRWVGLCDVSTQTSTNVGYLSRPARGLGWFNDNVIAFAESETMSLWDTRSEVKASSFSRCTPSSSGTLNCVSGLDDHLVACAGSDRVVYIIDDRTMKVVRHWRSPCKFDITAIMASQCNSNVIYLSGLDNEIMTCDITPSEKNKQKQQKQNRRPKLGTTNGNNVSSGDTSSQPKDVKEEEVRSVKSSETAVQLQQEEEVVGGHGRLHQSHSLGVRGDARWIGVSLCSSEKEEVVVGVCASGTLNVLRNPNLAKHARG